VKKKHYSAVWLTTDDNMKKYLFLLFFLLGGFLTAVHAQNKTADSLWQVYRLHPNDTIGASALEMIVNRHLSYTDPDSAQKVIVLMRKEARRTGWRRGEFLYFKDMGFIENRKMHLDQSLIYYDSAIAVAKQLNISYSSILGNMGGTYNRMRRYDESLKVLDEALSLAQTELNHRLECQVSMNLSTTYGNKGDVRTAIKYGVKAAEIAEKHVLKDLIGRTYMMLLPAFPQVRDTARQRFYAEKLIQLGQQDKNPQFQYQGHYFMTSYWQERLRGAPSMQSPQFQSALSAATYHIQQAETWLSAIKTPFERGEFWRIKARLLAFTGSHSDVVEALNKSRQANPFDEKTPQMVDYWMTLGESALQHHLPKDSTLAYYTHAARIAGNIGSHDQAARAYQLLATIYASDPGGNFEKAYDAYVQYKIYEDSALNIDKIREITALETGFNYERKQLQSEQVILKLNNDKLAQTLRIKQQTDELFRNKTEAEKREILLQLLHRDNEIQSLSLHQKDDSIAAQQLRLQLEQSDKAAQIASLRSQQEADARRRNTIIGILAGLLLLGALLFYFLRMRQKAISAKKLAEVEMRALRAQMNPHFLFNSMNTINTYILRNDTRAASDYLSRFAKVMRNVLENTQHPTNTLEKEIELLHQYLLVEKQRLGDQFEYQIKLDANEIDTYDTRVPGMILQPFVENAIIHGIRPKTEGLSQLTIGFKKRPDQKLCCTIEDNGVGRRPKPDNVAHTSMGIQITTDRLNIWHDNTVAEPIRFVDLKDSEGKPSGTKVEVIV
jgi:tetratricopeptide (TPR) repeat protein